MPKGIPNKRYTGEFKQMVVETMIREKLSYIETRKRFDIAGEDRVRSWERIYLTEARRACMLNVEVVPAPVGPESFLKKQKKIYWRKYSV